MTSHSPASLIDADSGIPGSSRLIVAGALIAASLPLLTVDGWPLHLLGYVLAAPTPFALVALHRRAIVRRREREGLVARRRDQVASWLLFASGLAVGLVQGVLLAYEVARR